MSKPLRYASVDALRGLTVAAMLLVNNPGSWGHVFAPLLHSEWNGCTPTDLVFPFFLFIVGVSIALGVVPRVEAGAAHGPLRRALLVRAVRIVGLGLVLHVLAWRWLALPPFRPWGVLQRIGLCFALAGLVAISLSPKRQWTLLVLLLAGYGGMLVAGGTLAPWHNLASRIDTALLGPAPAARGWPPAFTAVGLAAWGAAAGTTVSALSSANAAVTLFFVLKAATPL